MLLGYRALWHNYPMEMSQPIDDRAESFLQVGDVAWYIAEKHSHVSVDDVTHERWRQLMALLREFDTLVDDTSITNDKALQRLRDFTEFKERYPALSPDSLGSERSEALLWRTRRLLKLGQFIAQAETPERFVKLRINEGVQTANMLDDSATDYVKRQPNFTQRFLPVMRSLGTVACTIDSITDARQDYRTGKIAIRPDGDYYRPLVGASIAHAKLGAQALLHPSVMRQFAEMSMTRLRNRIAHGRTDSSSLNNFH